MKKRKRQAGSRGAISVFLTIILVPCMVFTCLFGDLSRVQLSRATTESAGDLALYSLLARYDEPLKEYYGLVASCQNIDEFYDTTANYFTGMLAAEGVPDSGSKLFMNYLHELQTNGYADFLRAEITEPAVVPAENAAVGTNPGLIEDGIVEFMKYRGPIQITANLIDNFSKMNFDKQIGDADENKQVVDKKQTYAEEQGELLETAFYSYLAIRQYDKEQESSEWPSQANYLGLSNRMTYIWEDLYNVTSQVARYYYPGTENIRNVIFPAFSVGDYTGQYSKEDVGTEVTMADGSTIYCLDNDKLESLMEGLDDKLEKIETAAQAFLANCQDIPAPGGDTNEVVYCMKMQQAADASNVVSILSDKGDSILKSYVRLEAAKECEENPEGSDLPQDWKEKLGDAQDKIDDVYDKYLNANLKTSDYWQKVNQYVGVADNNGVVNKVKNREYLFESKTCGSSVTIGGFVNNILGALTDIYSKLTAQRDRLNTAIDGGQITVNGESKKVVPLDELISKAQEFANARNDWGSEAGAHSTDYAKKEQELYQGASTAAEGGNQGDEKEVEGEKIAAQITDQSVQELKTRLVNIRDDINKAIDALDAFSYGGTVVKDLTGLDALINAAYTAVPENNDFSESTTRDAVKGYFKSLISTQDSDVCPTPTKNSAVNGNDPTLSAKPPALYKFLKDKFGDNEDAVESEISDNKKRTENYKKQGDEAKEKSKDVEADLVANKGKDLTDVHTENAVNALTALGSVVSVANNLVSGKGDELRDQLYVCEYIMDMFSYSDFDNEGKYRLAAEKAENGKGTAPTYQDFPYSAEATDWDTEDKTKVMRNQSLTNQPIVKDVHHANLGEVEYILYGSPVIDENLKTAYGNIFAIREMLNLVSGFCNFYGTGTETGRVINSSAAAVAAATAGIVPTPVTKCVLIAVLATLESASDLTRLKKGARVELYKGEKQWVYSLSNEGKAAEFSAGEAKEESGLYYSDYMYIFLLIGLSNARCYDSMLLRTGDLIQANMRLSTDNSAYSLSKSIAYFQLSAKVRVKPLMMALPIASTVEGADGMLSATNWCSYEAKIIRGYS